MARDRLSARERRWLVGLGVLYAAVVIPIGVHKGGDVVAEFGQSERLLHLLPLYPVAPAKGAWWPPFTILGLVPFALVARASVVLAKAAWAVLNVACLGWSLAQARRLAAGWLPVAIAVAAVAKPLQSNFEHLNLTPILLALVVQAAADLDAGREARAGAWIGLAGAIKAFPALMLVLFLWQRRWRGLAAGLATGAGLTLGALLPYGPAGAVRVLGAWLEFDRQRAAVGTLGSQSLAGLGFFFHWPPAAVAAAALLCLAALGSALRRPPATGRALSDVGLAALAAVLLSPVAWLYYHTLAFPAWVSALARPAPASRGPVRAGVLAVAGLLTSGALTFGLYPDALWFVREPNYTWGAALLFGVLAAERVRQSPAGGNRL
jgi:hypothetical protein